jgi:hypothetical protein
MSRRGDCEEFDPTYDDYPRATSRDRTTYGHDSIEPSSAGA